MEYSDQVFKTTNFAEKVHISVFEFFIFNNMLKLTRHPEHSGSQPLWMLLMRPSILLSNEHTAILQEMSEMV
jgi:hypothetical protein